MARVISVGRGWPTVSLLKRVRNTRPQTAVIPSARAANVRGALAARPFNLTGWDVWLVDDVKTTGSTLAACARLIRAGGAKSVSVAAVADAP